jgi:Bifunctional DNA primase/polymerase, N-terminal/Primase C terminal 1 (PriCT-1)
MTTSPSARDSETAAGETTLAAALAYAARGWPVFPVNGKAPLTERGFNDASAEPEQIRTWWRANPAAGVAIATGAPSGVLIVDIDAQKGGARAWKQLAGEHGKVPSTAATLTGGGGSHLLFIHPGGVPCSVGLLAEHVDVRGDGGYAILPPSVHETGRRYKWMQSPEKFGLAEAPEWLIKLARGRQNGRPSNASPLPEIIPEGRRNTELASIAGTLRRRGLGETEILSTLREVNRQRCQPPLDDNELDRIAGSVGRYTAGATLGMSAYTGPVRPIEDVVGVFSRWLLLPDIEPVYAVLGAVAANYLPGAPVWLILVSPPSNGKTELLGSFARLPDVYPASTLTEASLLSGTPTREHAQHAKGGLLREVGDFGIVVLKDLGSLLSMRPDDKAEVFAALREVFDGSYVRYVGADGGRQLAWTGKLGLVAGATPVLDRHHGVLSVMGERFLLCRLPEALEEQAERALAHTGELEAQMRQELADAVAALFAGERREPRPLDDAERRELVGLAALVARARSPVERDRHTREVELVPGAEGPARLAVTLERLVAGLDALGCRRDLALRVVRRVGLDSMPALRRQLLEQLCASPEPVATPTLAVAVHTPTNTVRRTLEDLTAYRLVTRAKQDQGKPDLWQVVDWARERFRGALPMAVGRRTRFIPPNQERVTNRQDGIKRARPDHAEPLDAPSVLSSEGGA